MAMLPGPRGQKSAMRRGSVYVRDGIRLTYPQMALSAVGETVTVGVRFSIGTLQGTFAAAIGPQTPCCSGVLNACSRRRARTGNFTGLAASA